MRYRATQCGREPQQDEAHSPTPAGNWRPERRQPHAVEENVYPGAVKQSVRQDRPKARPRLAEDKPGESRPRGGFR